MMHATRLAALFKHVCVPIPSPWGPPALRTALVQAACGTAGACIGSDLLSSFAGTATYVPTALA